MIDFHRYRPLYSADNEDARSELTALEIGSDDTVVTIAAGGGRALSLLTASPKRLIAIDRQPDQIYNLELKAAAIENLSYEAFSAFMGLTDDVDRLDHYHTLRASLSPSARRYWDNRRRLIESGVFYAGRTETARRALHATPQGDGADEVGGALLRGHHGGGAASAPSNP